MNFALIPFFLAVNVSVDDPNEWIHGPEYVFQANITYLLFPDLVKEPHRRISEILFVKCRPQAPENLLCFLKGDGIDSSNEDLSSEESPIKSSLDMPFLIEFSPRGVEHLRLMYVMDKLDLYFIRSIAKQLSVGADLRENANSLFEFEAKENYIFGECSTFFRAVEHDKDKDRPTKGIKERWNYDIQLLSLNRSRTDSVFVIEKTTESKRCVKAKDSGYRPQDVNVASISKMRISNNIFSSRTELHVHGGKTNVKKSPSLIHQDIINLELFDIEPAKEPLLSYNYDHVVPLHYKRTIDHNFLSLNLALM